MLLIGRWPIASRRCFSHAGDSPIVTSSMTVRDIAAAEVGRVDVDGGTALDRLAGVGVVERRLAERRAGERRDLARDADDGEPVGAVRRHGQLEQHVAEDVGERLPTGASAGSSRMPSWSSADAELVLAEHHAGGLDAADDGRLEDGRLAAVAVADARADGAEGDLLADGDVGRAADDAMRLVGAESRGDEPQAVGVRVRVDGGDAADADLVAPVAAKALDVVDGEAGARHAVGEFVRREVDVDVFAQPVEGDSHGAMLDARAIRFALVACGSVRDARDPSLCSG